MRDDLLRDELMAALESASIVVDGTRMIDRKAAYAALLAIIDNLDFELRARLIPVLGDDPQLRHRLEVELDESGQRITNRTRTLLGIA